MEKHIMNWLQKIAHQWQESHPDYDMGDHLHAAFSVVLPATDGKSWEEGLDVFYIPSMTYPYDTSVGGVGSFSNFKLGGFFFMHRDRMYRLDLIITIGEDSIEYLKQNGFKGTLNRSNDREFGISKNKKLGEAEANNPRDFIDQVISMIRADRFDNNDNDEEPSDIFPQWPYEETKYEDSDEESMALRNPRIRGNRL